MGGVKILNEWVTVMLYPVLRGQSLVGTPSGAGGAAVTGDPLANVSRSISPVLDS